MTGIERIVIVGGGLAAGRAAGRLCDLGWGGRLTVLTDEPHPPYERPPLSKDLLLHPDTAPDTAYVRPQEWYAEHDVDLRTSTRATGVDVTGSAVLVADERIPYDRLLLATGSRPRHLPEQVVGHDPGAALTYLRRIEDSVHIRERLSPGRHVVLVGGGWIALEVAAAARTAGCRVTVLERGDLPLRTALGHEVAQRFTGLHRDHGVDVRTHAEVARIRASDDSATVTLGDDTTIEADLVVVGIGAEPNVDLGVSAGLAVSDGIDTDRFLRTAAHDVYVAGDAARPYHPRYRRHLRVEHWDNALHQGEQAALNMVDAPAAYDRVPYVFTDQFELGMEYVGHVGSGTAYRVLVRGSLADDHFVVFWAHRGRVAAAMHVNEWDAIGPLRRLVEAGHPADDPRLLDADVSLDQLAEKASDDD